MKKLLSTTIYRGAYGALYCVSLIPMSILYGISSVIYFLAYRVPGYRRAVVIQNISRSFPEKSYIEVLGITKKFYAGLADCFVEIVKSVSITPRRLDARLTFEGLEHLAAHLDGGRNVIVCMGHCGNWEMLNYLPRKITGDMYAVYRPLRSPTADRLMKKLRSRFGMKLIEDRSVVRHILSAKTPPSAYVFLADQRPRTRDEGYRFELLNQPTYHFSGMERLARISRSAVVYLHIHPLARGRYAVVCTPLCADAGETAEGEITRRYVEQLTLGIRRWPQGWLWSHKRWK